MGCSPAVVLSCLASLYGSQVVLALFTLAVLQRSKGKKKEKKAPEFLDLNMALPLGCRGMTHQLNQKHYS